MAVWTVKGGVFVEVPADTGDASDDAAKTVTRGRGRPPKAREESTQTEGASNGDDG